MNKSRREPCTRHDLRAGCAPFEEAHHHHSQSSESSTTSDGIGSLTVTMSKLNLNSSDSGRDAIELFEGDIRVSKNERCHTEIGQEDMSRSGYHSQQEERRTRKCIQCQVNNKGGVCDGYPLCRSCRKYQHILPSFDQPETSSWISVLDTTLQQLVNSNLDLLSDGLSAWKNLAARLEFRLHSSDPNITNVFNIRLPTGFLFRRHTDQGRNVPSCIKMPTLDRLAEGCLSINRIWSGNTNMQREIDRRFWSNIYLLLGYVSLLYQCPIIFEKSSNLCSDFVLKNITIELVYALGWRIQQLQADIIHACEDARNRSENTVSGQVLFYCIEVVVRLMTEIEFIDLAEHHDITHHALIEVYQLFLRSTKGFVRQLMAIECILWGLYTKNKFPRRTRKLPEHVRQVRENNFPTELFKGCTFIVHMTQFPGIGVSTRSTGAISIQRMMQLFADEVSNAQASNQPYSLNTGTRFGSSSQFCQDNAGHQPTSREYF